MSRLKNEAIERLLGDLSCETSISEFHGLMTGYLCAKTNSTTGERLELYREWLDAEVGKKEVEAMDELYQQTEESLGEFSDFEFRILLPDDETSVTRRSKALSEWCTGFLSGFGSAGRFSQADLTTDVTEAFTDFSKISSLGKEVDAEMPDSEENEVDLMEICEYVRISVLLIFTECGGAKRTH
jgi:uncharacterized protein YgfB (UPF0149 family)